MSVSIPINPVVLKWARKTSGYSKADVIEKLKRKKVGLSTLEDWESGISSPSYAQLENLAYNIYKRPLAIFFFPSPPVEDNPSKSFRTLPEFEISSIDPHLYKIIKQAYIMKINLNELYENKNEEVTKLFSNFNYTPNTPIKTMISDVREYLKISLVEQKKWKNAEEGFKIWRECFERHGIFVFKDAFKNESISGFCIYDNQFPIIYVNNSKPFTRQIFTLFHELAHLLMKTGGIDKNDDEYFKYLEGDDYKIEILCNKFAGEFLVPDDDISSTIYSYSDIDLDNSIIANIAQIYKVSREVILRKFLDAGIIDTIKYSNFVKEWYNNKTMKSNNVGGNYYLTKGTYLGYNYLNLVFRKYYQNQISSLQLASYLDIKPNNIPTMEQIVIQRGGAA